MTEPISQYGHIHMPFTIERQLMAYKNHPEHDVQHEVLWTTWCHNKRMLEQLLRWTLVSFPMYSRHDESHSTSVLRNMERILGEERIKRLSASDAFALLHVAYEHDIGMCITDADREKIVSSPEFLEMLERISQGSDQMLAAYVQLIKDCCPDDVQPDHPLTEQEKCQHTLKKNLKIYHAMTELLTMYQRIKHGQIAQRRLQDTLASPKSRFSEQFCVSDISNRIFYWIAQCAALHTVWEFDEILKLPFEDDGAASDKMHPRFVAVMLQLGDALDMDCGRFPLLMEEFSGQLSAETKKHLKKHESIRMLCINDRKIEVRASCEDHSVSRLIQAECKGIDQILRNASYHWSEIAPGDLPGMLPSFELSEMTVQGAKIPPQLINASFRISQKKAFSLLEGSNIYIHKLVFLREVLQNAFDASKLQYWKDYLGLLSPQGSGSLGYAPYTPRRGGSEVLFDAARRLPLDHYPVVVRLTVCAVTVENAYVSPATAAEATAIMENFARAPYHSFGVRVEVQDCGIGVGESDLSFIADLGTESKDKQQLKASMPDVLYPTGSFGIGLQSIFLAADHFHIQTRTKTGEAYNIRFSSMTGSEDGIINTTSLSDAYTLPFGTKVTINVSSEQKNTDPSIFKGSQVSYDPFVATEAEKKLHEAEELLVQMVMYLNEILGERLFPLRVELENLFSGQMHPWLDRMLEDPRNLHFELTYTLRGGDGKKETSSPAQTVPPLSWALLQDSQLNENHLYGQLDNGDRYWFDLDEGKLHVWCDDVGAFAAYSATRFCEIMGERKDDSAPQSIPLYYKGIKMSDSIPFARNLDLLDFVDLKNKRTADILQLNRHYLTEEGKAFFSQTVGSAVMRTVRRVFLHMAGDPYEVPVETEAEEVRPIDKIHQKMEDSINVLCDPNTSLPQEELFKISERAISIILLLFLGKMLLHTDLVVDFQACGAGTIRPMEECPWDRALKDIDSYLTHLLWENDDPIMILQKVQALRKNSPFVYVLTDSWEDNGLNDSGHTTTLASLFSSNDRYAVFSLCEDPPSQDGTKYRILQFRTRSDKFKDEVRKAANSAKQVSTSLNRANNWNETDLRYRENLARWLIHNIPTSQFYTQRYTPSSGRSSYQNYRYEFCVLEVTSVRWIETNALTQYCLLERMRDQIANQSSARFVTAVWDEAFHCLTIPQKAMGSMCSVYPKPMPAYATPKMLIPIDAEHLKALMEEQPEHILDKLGGALLPCNAAESDMKTYCSSRDSIAKCFSNKFQEYEKVRRQFITKLPTPYRLALDDWQHDMQRIPCKRGKPEHILCDFLTSNLVLNPECFSDLPQIDVQTFQKCLTQIYSTISASEEALPKAIEEMFSQSQGLLKGQTFFSQREDVETLVQAFYYDRGRLEQVICKIFVDHCQQEIKQWRKLPETLRLADYVATHSINRISRETALALNEILYRNIIEIIAAHRSADFLTRSCES